jgi:hypothetical protein
MFDEFKFPIGSLVSHKTHLGDGETYPRVVTAHLLRKDSGGVRRFYETECANRDAADFEECVLEVFEDKE